MQVAKQIKFANLLNKHELRGLPGEGTKPRTVQQRKTNLKNGQRQKTKQKKLPEQKQDSLKTLR